MVVSANQNPFPADYEYPVAGNYEAYFRSRQIQDRLASRSGWKAEELLTVQKDVYSAFSHFLARELVAAYDRRNARTESLDRAVATLRNWNGQMDREMAAPFLVSLAYPQLRTAIAENAAPGKGSAYAYPIGAAVIDRLLRERPPGWFKDWDETLLRVLVDSVEEGSRIQGRNIDRWRYGQMMAVGLNHPVLHSIPWIGRYFDLKPVAVSGSPHTVNQTTRRVGPSERMNLDLADWDRSLLNLPVGQSGQVLSSHYRDQRARFHHGLSYPMQFEKVEAKDILELRPK
jgi:penicillin amidase